MNDKNILSGVEDTLYIPLLARIYASEKFPEFFYDEKAVSLKRYIPSNDIEKNTGEYFYMASVCRQYTIDEIIEQFLSENKQSNVVFLGAGLETAYNCINNVDADFYQIDLPPVIEVRRKLLKNAENEHLIAGDMFTMEWVNQINTSLPTMIVISGVFQYFKQDKIASMIRQMKSSIPKGELVFDATNSSGLKLANKYVQKTGNENAKMYFAVDNPSEFANVTGTRLMSVSGFFDGALKNCKGLSVKTKIYMYFADKWHRTLVVHLGFDKN